MEFREVTEFIPGTKYLILCYDIKFIGFYSRTEYEMFYTFHTVQGEHFHNELQFSQVCNTFYLPKFQRDRIQSDMEHRAVNLILRNITGDPTFTW
jgi:hypothetical protein